MWALMELTTIIRMINHMSLVVATMVVATVSNVGSV